LDFEVKALVEAETTSRDVPERYHEAELAKKPDARGIVLRQFHQTTRDRLECLSTNKEKDS
jgi:hypothetical protein